MNHRNLVGVGALVACTTLAAGSVAFASPGVNAPMPENLKTGVLDGPSKAKKDGVELKLKGDTTVRSFVLRYLRGSNSGWHSHPGVVVALVESGSVTRQTVPGCLVETFSEGDVFTEVAGHLVSNPSATTDAVLRITQFVPEGATPLRVELPADTCQHKKH